MLSTNISPNRKLSRHKPGRFLPNRVQRKQPQRQPAPDRIDNPPRQREVTTIHTRFCREWTLITDRLLAGAAINPKRFTELVEDFGLRPSFTPDDLTYDLFVLLQAIGEGDIACSAESIADELSRWCRHDRDDILNVLTASGAMARCTKMLRDWPSMPPEPSYGGMLTAI